jgi:hypothetical protein
MDQEHEFDPALKDVIKDADTEKKFRELYEKAHGLEYVKPRFQALQQKYQEMDGAHKQLTQGIGELRELYGRGDFDNFFKKLQIPEQKILQWVLDKAQYSELPVEQRQMLDARKSAEQRAYELEKKHQEMESQFQEQVTTAKGALLQVALAKPDVQAFSESYDQRVGQPGAFRQQVAKHGEWAWFASNGQVDLTPEQAIAEVMKYAGGMPTSQPGAQATPQVVPAAQVVAQKTQARGGPSVLPHVAGKTASPPAKSKPKSIEDLKALYKQMSN